MKKAFPYLLIVLALVATFYFLFAKKTSGKKKISTWITLSKNDKNPYGTYVFYNSLKKIFPLAKINSNTESVYGNTLLNGADKNSLYIILLPFLEIDEYELEELMHFVEKGNNLFVSSFYTNNAFERLIKVKTGAMYTSEHPFGNTGPYNMKQTLVGPAFAPGQTFRYPGQLMEGYFLKTDSTISRSLALGNNDKVNFIQLKRGNGNLFVHLSPMAFSNYFLLYDNNHRYFEQIFSLLPADTKTIIWDEYFTAERHDQERKKSNPGWFTSIMKEPAFRAGILTALLLLIIYTIIEMRRRQRYIPVISPPVNDSLEFVKTMGLLYYQRKDHQNLAQKMSAYFLEHLRGRYKIFSRELNDNFVKEVSYKSGVSESLVSSIVQQVKRVNDNVPVSDTELISLQKNIDEFYDRE